MSTQTGKTQLKMRIEESAELSNWKLRCV